MNESDMSDMSVNLTGGSCNQRSCWQQVDCCTAEGLSRSLEETGPLRQAPFSSSVFDIPRVRKFIVPKDHAPDEDLLARELYQLTLQEREQIFDEVHGVAKFTEESPTFVYKMLAAVRDEIRQVPKLKRRYWDRAVFLKPQLEYDDKFLLMFLRSDRYHSRKAAYRVCKFFEYKSALFGKEKLVHKITMEDMSPDDLEVFRTGSFRIVPKRDSAGRLVWLFSQHRMKFKHWTNMIRYVWYQVMQSVVDNDDVQIHGIVDVVYCIGTSEMGPSYVELMTHGGDILTSSLPYRIAGMHYCYDDSRLRPALALLQLVVGKEMRLRFRTHFGSHLETKYILASFGIPVFDLAISIDEETNIKMNDDYITDQQRKDSTMEEIWFDSREADRTRVALYPSNKDVLLGRGKPYQEYVGNLYLASLVDQRREQYHHVADRFEKTCIAMGIVKTIEQSGGHFLQRTEEGWVPVPVFVAREKVSHCFRTKTTRSTSISPKQSLAPSDTFSAQSNENRTDAFESPCDPPPKRTRYTNYSALGANSHESAEQ